jgi:hypothetical protein
MWPNLGLKIGDFSIFVVVSTVFDTNWPKKSKFLKKKSKCGPETDLGWSLLP